MIPVRFYLIGVAVLALAGLLWHDHHQTQRANREARRADTAESSLTTLRAAVAHERKIAKEASDGYQKDLAELQRERTGVPVVRLCKPARAAVPAAAGAAGGPDAAGAGRVGEAPALDPVEGPDIGAALIDYGIACEANALQLTRLQEWVRAR